MADQGSLLPEWQEFIEEHDYEPTVELELGSTPLEWSQEGVDYQFYRMWYDVGGFNPSAVGELIDAGLTPDDCKAQPGSGDEKIHLYNNAKTIAVAYCDGIIDLDLAKQLAGVADQTSDETDPQAGREQDL